MKRLALALALALGAPLAHGAEITRTLEAFVPQNPWDANVEISYGRSLRRALVSREKAEGSESPSTRYFDDKELRYTRIDHTMDFRFRFALYKDLEVFLNLPIVLSRSQHVGLALNNGEPGTIRTGGCDGAGRPTGDSTVIRDGLFRGGGISSAPDPTQTQLEPGTRNANRNRTILGQAGVNASAGCYMGESGVPGQTMRSGFGDLSIGMAWAPLNNRRDDTDPTWLLRLEYQLPSGTTMDPTPRDPAGGNFSPRNDTVGLGQHALHFGTYFSKKVHSAVEPYVGLEYSAFFPADNPIFRRISPNQEHIGPGQRAGIVAGLELIPWEDRKNNHRFAIDLRLRARANFEGRDYSELADFLGRVTDIEAYATFEAQLGFYVQLSKWFLGRFHVGLAADTKHFITFANIGQDRILPLNGFVENDVREQNPTYDPLTDQVGRRLSVSETTVFTWGFSLIAMF